MVEEACAHVQGESLKAQAAPLWKLINSPITSIWGAVVVFRKVLIITGILVFASGAIFGSTALRLKQKIWPPPPPAPVVGPGSVQYDTEVLRHQSRSQQIDGALVFIGDSQVEALAASNVATRTENLGMSSDTLRGLRQRLSHYRLSGARAIVLEIGINDIVRGYTSDFGARYSDLLNSFPPAVPVVAVAIFPVRHPAPLSRNTNKLIQQANRQISQACSHKNNCRFLSLFAEMTEDGELAAKYSQPDGVHLSYLGAYVWTQALKRLAL